MQINRINKKDSKYYLCVIVTRYNMSNYAAIMTPLIYFYVFQRLCELHEYGIIHVSLYILITDKNFKKFSFSTFNIFEN